MLANGWVGGAYLGIGVRFDEESFEALHAGAQGCGDG